MTLVPAITSFSGRYHFLSNFSASPIRFDGATYPTVEHAFQAAKTEDREARHKIARAATPGIAKRLGRSVELRPGWDDIRDLVMLRLLRLKFSDPELAEKLDATGDKVLIEGNHWHDTYWGAVWSDGMWRGKNTLGKLLMQIREELRNG